MRVERPAPGTPASLLQYPLSRTRTRQRTLAENGRTADKNRPPLPPSGAPGDPLQKLNGFNGLQARKRGSRVAPELWRAIVETEIFGGRKWDVAVSRDGVACEVSRP